MMPGARLYIGPHGQPEESLGACCSNCVTGRPCAAGADDEAPPPAKSGVKTASILAILGVAVVGAVILYPKAWDRYMDSLWK